VTWGICYEFLRVVTHPRVLRKPWNSNSAWRFIKTLLETPGLELLIPTVRHADVAAEVLAEHEDLAGNMWHDATTVVFFNDTATTEIYTRDNDFHRFALIEPIDPMHSGHGN
jgi:predicted nucleic acid-binding protein